MNTPEQPPHDPASQPPPSPPPPQGQPAPQGYPSQTPPQQPAGSNGLAVAALVLGIIGIIFGLIPVTFFIALICGVLALIFGLIGRSKAKKENRTGAGMALAGAITGAIAIVLGLVMIFVIGQAFNELERGLQDLELDLEELENLEG